MTFTLGIVERSITDEIFRINNAKEKYHEEIESLMTLRFQTFENVKFLAV